MTELETSLRKVIIISFYFPPYADISGIRALKFCKFLPEYGWEPWVLTIDKGYYGKKIVDRPPKELESIRTVRMPYIGIKGAKIFAALLFPLFILLQTYHKRRQIDAVCMIGSPYHPFILTPILRKLFHLNISLDFRDSWSYNFGFDGKETAQVGYLARAKKRLFFAIEKIALKYATFATFATPVLRDEYAFLIPAFKNKYYSILNGFDEEDFDEVRPLSLCKNKTIILAGKFYLYTPGVVKIFLELIDTMEGVTFIYVGNESDIIRSIAREIGLAENKLIVKDYKPYDDVLRLIAGSDFCLLTNGVVNGMGTKIFDYLALGKPTLCLVPQGSIIAQHFSGTKGVIVSEAPHTRENLALNLKRLLRQDLNSVHIDFTRFSRRNGTKMLAQYLADALT